MTRTGRKSKQARSLILHDFDDFALEAAFCMANPVQSFESIQQVSEYATLRNSETSFSSTSYAPHIQSPKAPSISPAASEEWSFVNMSLDPNDETVCNDSQHRDCPLNPYTILYYDESLPIKQEPALESQWLALEQDVGMSMGVDGKHLSVPMGPQALQGPYLEQTTDGSFSSTSSGDYSDVTACGRSTIVPSQAFYHHPSDFSAPSPLYSTPSPLPGQTSYRLLDAEALSPSCELPDAEANVFLTNVMQHGQLPAQLSSRIFGDPLPPETRGYKVAKSRKQARRCGKPDECHPCGEILRDPATGKEKLCTKVFRRTEHLSRHMKIKGHGGAAAPGLEEVHCEYPACKYAVGKMAFVGERNDNKKDHIINTHLLPANKWRNDRVDDPGKIAEYGWEKYLPERARKMQERELLPMVARDSCHDSADDQMAKKERVLDYLSRHECLVKDSFMRIKLGLSEDHIGMVKRRNGISQTKQKHVNMPFTTVKRASNLTGHTDWHERVSGRSLKNRPRRRCSKL